MESGRFLLAIVLMIAVVVVTNILFPPAPAPQEPVPPVSGGAAGEAVVEEVEAEAPVEPAVETPSVAGPPATGPVVQPVPGLAPTTATATDTVLVESALYRYGFSTATGGLVMAELLEFESFRVPGPVDLVPEANALIDYRLRVGDQVVDLSELPLQVEPAGGLTLEPGTGADTLHLRYGDPGGTFALELDYIFRPGRYAIDVRGSVQGLGGTASPILLLDIGPTLAVHEADPEEDYRALAYVFNNTESGVASVSLDDVEGTRVEEGPLVWAAIKSKYFLAAALSRGEAAGEYFGGLIATDVPGEHTAVVTATLPVGRDQEFAYQLFLGPQESERLAGLGRALEDVNPYGWQIFRPIIRPLAHVIIWALVGLQDVLAVGYGWVLILFGFLIRGLLWPLQSKAMRSQIKNMELQPLMKEIQTKYKGEPERLQKEMIRLYKEEGFNPLGGCLPMLLPFPVLITLFFVFQSTIEFRGVEFLWLPDLSRADPLYILPVLLGASMFVQQWLSMRSTTTSNPQMKMMMWFMPIFMVVVFLNLASGLNLYYAASNLAGVPQQLQVMKERRRAQGRIGKT